MRVAAGRSHKNPEGAGTVEGDVVMEKRDYGGGVLFPNPQAPGASARDAHRKINKSGTKPKED